ncbi:MAG: hypothetical protein Q8Q09_26085 [Deltaproteobacteria bacterium]|nr:hypothetical protein [Deltaproteobacteria bacterium]
MWRALLPSIAFSRETFARLNFTALDASDSMMNFVHRMKFARTTGFSAIEPLKREELPTPDRLRKHRTTHGAASWAEGAGSSRVGDGSLPESWQRFAR